MTEEKPISWKLDPHHVSIWGNVLDDKIEGHRKLRSKLEELYDKKHKEDDSNES